MKHVSINGEILLKEFAKISVEERLCRFGDGAFETCRIENGLICSFASHLKRLISSLDALRIDVAKQVIAELEMHSYRLIRENLINSAILRISISRGIGSAGYLPISNSKPLVIIETLEKRQLPQGVLKLGISKIAKPSKISIPVAYKLISSTSSILAKIEAESRNLFDVIMLNKDGFIAETSSSNIFLVKKNVIYTPSKTCDILLGTTRESILKTFPNKIRLVKVKVDQLMRCDEIFLTNAANGVVPIDELYFGKNVIKLTKRISLEVSAAFEEKFINNL